MISSPGFITLLLLPFSSLMVKLMYFIAPMSMLFTAARALTFPEPVSLFFVSDSFSAVVSSNMLISAGVKVLSFESIRHITPATQGAAIDVPVFFV